MKKVSILQTNYIPWKGYFNIIALSDEFIFHDDLQYTKQDWRNRNKIKTPEGLIWLTLPCGINTKRLINEVKIESFWLKNHWEIIKQYYSKAKYFEEYENFFEDIFLKEWKYLSEFNQYSIKKISKEIFGLSTKFSNSVDYNSEFSKQDRVIDICKKAGTDIYISGQAAKSYIDEKLFLENGIKVQWMQYKYKEYEQLYPPFEHGVSIIDLIFNQGEKSKYYAQSI